MERRTASVDLCVRPRLIHARVTAGPVGSSGRQPLERDHLRPMALHSASRSRRSDGSASSPKMIVSGGTSRTSIGRNALRARSDNRPFTRTS